MLEVFFYEAFQEEEAAIRSYLPAGIKVGFTWQTIQESAAVQPPAALISMRTQSVIPVAWATQLQGILSRSTGYDHLHRYWQACKVVPPCGYLPLYCSRAVAEQAMLLWMALLRKLSRQVQQFGTFHREGLTGWECQQKTLVVVGVGQIGQEVVKIGQALGMNVLGVDLVERHPEVTYVSIEEGLAQANILVSAMNLTPSNRNYFNYQLFKQAKRGLIFINIARGELSPPHDLLRLLDEQWLAGVALDVYDRESELAVSLRTGQVTQNKEILATLELAKRPEVILTPHNAFNTQEAVLRKALHSVQQVEYFIENGCFRWPVPQL